MKKVEILGPGCQKCKFVEEQVKKAIEELGVDAKVEEVKDTDKIVEYGVMITPAVVVDGKVKAEGNPPSKEELEKWLK